MSKPLIEIKNMSKIYEMGSEKVHALDDVDLTVFEHEFIAVIGASGSGKSTLMNMIGCLDSPTSGQYNFEGINIASFDENQLAHIRNRKVGFIFQQFNLFSKLTAFENVEMPAKFARMSRDVRREKTLNALKSVGLLDRMNHRPTELSGGQQQRVAIARSLVNSPPLILADEPTGNLDSKSGVDVMNMIHKLHDDGNTILLITHDDEVASEADRIIRLKDGKIISDIRNNKEAN